MRSSSNSVNGIRFRDVEFAVERLDIDIHRIGFLDLHDQSRFLKVSKHILNLARSGRACGTGLLADPVVSAARWPSEFVGKSLLRCGGLCY